MDKLLRTQQRLNDGQDSLEAGTEALRAQKREFEQALQKTQEQDEELQAWLDEHEEEKEDEVSTHYSFAHALHALAILDLT